MPQTDDEEALARPPLFAALPGGTRTGLFLHSILERCDFPHLDDDATHAMIESQLRDYGLPTTLASDVRSDLAIVAETPLLRELGGPTLVDLQRALRELEFTLSLDRPRLDRLADFVGLVFERS